MSMTFGEDSVAIRSSKAKKERQFSLSLSGCSIIRRCERGRNEVKQAEKFIDHGHLTQFDYRREGESERGEGETRAKFRWLSAVHCPRSVPGPFLHIGPNAKVAAAGRARTA